MFGILQRQFKTQQHFFLLLKKKHLQNPKARPARSDIEPRVISYLIQTARDGQLFKTQSARSDFNRAFTQKRPVLSPI